MNNGSAKNQIKELLSLALICLLLSCNEKIPIVKISAENDLIWKEKLPCEINIQKPNKTAKHYTAFVKFRGGSSAQFNKHSLTVEFDKKLSLGEFEKDDDWIFNASYIDKTFMRHKICSDLFLQMHPENKASHSSYIELYLNDVYQGLYLVQEEINAGNLKIDKGDSLAMLFKDPPLFFEERIPYPQDSSSYFQQKFPKKKERDQTYYIESFKEFLFCGNDSIFELKIKEWIDIRNVIDWHLLLLLTNNSDGIMKNFYLYKLDAKTPFRIAIWDYDHSFGRDGDNEMNLLDREVDCTRSILLKRLLTLDSYQLALKNRWIELSLEGLFSLDNLQKKIKENRKIILPYLKENSEIWPLNGAEYHDANTFNQEIEIMEKYLELRFNQLNRKFEYHQN